MTMEAFSQCRHVLDDHNLSDEYHVLCVKGRGDDFTMQVFYEKDFDQVKYEELKAIIEKACS